MILSLKNVGKEFTQGDTLIKALEAINFELEEGKSLSLLGPSGSGKTTLLSLLAGLDAPSTGEILVQGQRLDQLSEKELSLFRAQNIGLIFQQFHLMSHLSAEENISLPQEILKLPQIKENTLKALEAVGLSHRKNHLPSQLSGGECQRVAIARAIVTRPKILLADEPSGNLDTSTGRKVMDLIFNLAQEIGTTLILVTHDEELGTRCDRTLRLSGGRIQ